MDCSPLEKPHRLLVIRTRIPGTIPARGGRGDSSIPKSGNIGHSEEELKKGKRHHIVLNGKSLDESLERKYAQD